MSPAFLVNYVTGRRQITNVTIDWWLSEVLFPEKIYVKKQFKDIYACMHHGSVCEYMNLLRNGAYNLFVNTHVRIKIYREFHYGIIYKANERLHVWIDIKKRSIWCHNNIFSDFISYYWYQMKSIDFKQADIKMINILFSQFCFWS